MEFEASRLIQARQRRALTKKALAEAAGLSDRSISLWESGDQQPSKGTVETLARTLRYPVGFFYRDETEALIADDVAFRSMSRMSARDRDAALAAGAAAVEFSDWLDQRFDLPVSSWLDTMGPPSSAAEEVRADWGLGYAPLPNLVHLCEARGARVFSLVDQSRNVNAFSFWRHGRPFIFLHTTGYTAERSRFDLAHEIGHLVLHRHGAPHGQQAESEANEFAAALLMPERDIRAQLSGAPTLRELVAAKSRWGVAVSALAYRCQSLGLLSEWHYRRMMIEISKRGWRRSEPQEMSRETSQLLAKTLRALRDDGLGPASIAEQLGWHVDDLSELLFGLATVSFTGGGSGTPSRQPVLRLVGSR